MKKFYTTLLALAAAIPALRAAELPEITITPSPDAMYESISEVLIKFHTDHELLVMGHDACLLVDAPDGMEYEIIGDWVDYDTDPTTLRFEFDPAFTMPGKYHFILPEETICDYENMELDLYPAVEFDITVVEPYSQYSEVSPVPGSYEGKLPSNVVTVRYKDMQSVSIAEGAKAEVILPSGDKTEIPIVKGTAANEVAVDLGDTATVGSYNIKVDAGSVSGIDADGGKKDFPVMSLAYNVVDRTYVVAPPAGPVYQLWTILINFPAAKSVKVITSLDDIVLNGPGDTTEDIIAQPIFNAIDITVESNRLPAGEYVLSVKPGTLSVDGLVIDDEIRIVYTMSSSGVEDVRVEGAAADIFGIDGTLKARNASGTDNLEPGIYISNGKKIIVK